MPRMDVTQMSFGKLYPLLVNKAMNISISIMKKI